MRNVPLCYRPADGVPNQPEAYARLDPFVHYPQQQELVWPTLDTPTPFMFWARWSGALEIFLDGEYAFDLEAGGNARSSLKIDHQAIVTPGQCRMGGREECEKRGCVWKEKCGVARPPTVALKKGRHCVEALVRVKGPSQVSLKYMGKVRSPREIFHKMQDRL